MRIYPSELLIMLLWVIAPAILLAAVFLRLPKFNHTSKAKLRYWPPLIALFVLVMVQIVLLLFTPASWLSRNLGAQHVVIFGFHTMWLPMAYIATTITLPLVIWWKCR